MCILFMSFLLLTWQVSKKTHTSWWHSRLLLFSYIRGIFLSVCGQLFKLLVKKFRFLLLFHCIWKWAKKVSFWIIIVRETFSHISKHCDTVCTQKWTQKFFPVARHFLHIFKHCDTFYHKFKSFYKSRDFQSALLNRKRTLQRTTDGYQDWLRSTVLWKGKDPLSPA